jgi:hypothetical protein
MTTLELLITSAWCAFFVLAELIGNSPAHQGLVAIVFFGLFVMILIGALIFWNCGKSISSSHELNQGQANGRELADAEFRSAKGQGVKQ